MIASCSPSSSWVRLRSCVRRLPGTRSMEDQQGADCGQQGLAVLAPQRVERRKAGTGSLVIGTQAPHCELQSSSSRLQPSGLRATPTSSAGSRVRAPLDPHVASLECARVQVVPRGPSFTCGWSLREQPRAKPGYQRPTLLAAQPAKCRTWSPGDQDPRKDGPQGPSFVRRLVPRGPPTRMPVDGWCSKDQDLRAGGPWGTNPVRDLVTRDPPFWLSGDQDAGSGPLVSRLRAKMVLGGPTSSSTWSPRNHLARCPKTPGPQGTRFCVRAVPRGSTSPATWSLVHHPRRRPRRPGHGGTRTCAKLVPTGPSSCGIWSPVIHLARFLAKEGGRGGSRRTAFRAGLVPAGPGLAATLPSGAHPHPDCRLLADWIAG
ncbi:MAG: hypothetical protein PWR07_1835 [Bacillota bacterium]|nr:hypothetical protein [Bacillota bacterium]